MKDLHTELPYETAKKLRAAGMPIQFIWQDEGPRLCCNATWADAAEWLMKRGVTVTVYTESGYISHAKVECGIFTRIFRRMNMNESGMEFLDRVIAGAIEFCK